MHKKLLSFLGRLLKMRQFVDKLFVCLLKYYRIYFLGVIVLKRMIHILALVLSTVMVITALPCSVLEAAPAWVSEVDAAFFAELEQGTSSYTASGYKTYTMSDASLKWKVSDYTEGGIKTTGMQGMNTGISYCYVAKNGANDAYSDLIRINMDTGAVTEMNYYASTSATATTACNSLKHANEISVVGIGNYNYLYACTLNTGKSITRYKIDGTKFMLTGWFNVVNSSGNNMGLNGLRAVKRSGGYVYFLICSGRNFSVCRIPENSNGGTESNPEKVTAYRIFQVDTRNTVVATSNSAYRTVPESDSYTMQGMGYNISEGVVYLPMWAGSLSNNTNLISTYNVKDNINEWLETTKDLSNYIYPTKTAFYFQNTAVSFFEVESCSFRNGTGYNGDNKLYFNTNGGTAATEGVFAFSYTTGSGDFTPINEGKTTYKVVYNANGGTGSTSATNHVRGIANTLRKNSFTRDGYSFAGWYLTRKGDGKWLYYDANGTANWYAKGSQPKNSYLALYKDEQTVSMLSHFDNDTVTCYAQWTPVSTGTKSFYIQYDANGGTGTMADTKIVYGTGTRLTANSFVRDGYSFVGWTVFARSRKSFAYKNRSDYSNMWIITGNDTSAAFLKTYPNGTTLSATSSTDRDILTFYAAWARVKDGVYPTQLTEGEAFVLGGAIESTTDMGGVIVRIKDSAGNAVQSSSAAPYTNSYSLSTATLDFSSLSAGEYTLEVVMQTYDVTTPHNHTLYSGAFSVLPARLMLTDGAVSEGVYKLGEDLTGVELKSTVATVLARFKNPDVRVSAPDGSFLDSNAVVGTGCFVGSYINGELSDGVFIAVKGDIDGDGGISSSDYLGVSSALQGASPLTGCYRAAGDVNGDAVLNSTDSLTIAARLMGNSEQW